MLITVRRLASTPESTSGELLLDGVHECWTLEPRLDQSQGKPYAIPAGTYTYTVGPSVRFGRNVIKVENVPGFTAIEVHYGNYPADTDGCTLVGQTAGTDFVGNSVAAFDELMSKVEPTGQIEYIDLPIQQMPNSPVSKQAGPALPN